MALSPFFYDRSIGPLSYLDPISTAFGELFEPLALSTPSLNAPTISGSSFNRRPIHNLERMAASAVVEVRDYDDKYQVLCKPPPDFTENDLNVRIDRDILSLTGQHSEREEEGIKQSMRSFTRLIRLPDTVDQQQISAKWTPDGLLVQLPKKAGALESGRRIQIEGVENQPSSESTLSSTPSHHRTSSGDFRTGGAATPMESSTKETSGIEQKEPVK